MEGWRTVVISDFDSLSLENGQLVVAGKTEASFPLSQLRDLIITDPVGSVTVPLLNALSEAGINTVFCDKRRSPSFRLEAFHAASGTAGCIMEQAAWQQDRKDYIWGAIVMLKIATESGLLSDLGLNGAGAVFSMMDNLQLGDADNREGLAARLYFHCLFGPDFRRHRADELNTALNYGYSILLSMMTRIITVHGYTSVLGIHHRNEKNPYNLACDLMEPFRAFVDKVVYLNRGRSLDWDYKKELIAVTQGECLYEERKMDIATAMEMLFLDTIRSMREGKLLMKGVHFVG